MGWHRAGWYTARWVDKLLFPLNWPSASRIIPGLQHIQLGDFTMLNGVKQRSEELASQRPSAISFPSWIRCED